MTGIPTTMIIAATTILMCLQICHQSEFAVADERGPSLEMMRAKYKTVKTISAEFSQKQTNLALGTTKETSGHLSIKRPDKFRWQTEQPVDEASILVSNGKKVWYYKPPRREGGRGQVYIREAADVQSKLLIDLLDGQANISKDFKTKDLGAGRFELKPLKPAGDIERIELFLERPTKLIYKLVLFTMTGNQTELTLKSVALDPQLSDKMFNFVPPEKTEEIY